MLRRYRHLLKLLPFLLLSLQVFCGWEKGELEGNRAVEILDGDTIKLSNGITVRYLGIDAPEEGEPFYLEAKKSNEKLVKGRMVRLELDLQARDKYDRMLAYVYADTTMVNLQLLKQGLAVVYSHPPNVRYLQEFCAVQKQARHARLRIWSLPSPPGEARYLALEDSYRFHRPSCPALKNRSPEELRIYSSREEALNDCLSPCRTCKP